MQKLDFSILKKKPVLIGGGIVVGGILLFALLRGGGSSASSASSGPSAFDQQMSLLNAQSGAAMAQQTSAQNFQLASLQLQANNEANIATMQYSLEGARLEKEYTLQTLALQTQKYLTEFNANVATAQAKLGYDYQLKSQQSNEAYLNNQLTSQLEAQKYALNVNTQNMMFQTSVNADLQKSLASISAESLNKQVEFQYLTTVSTNTLQRDLAKIQSDTTIANAQIAAKAAKSNANTALFGGILKAAIGLF